MYKKSNKTRLTKHQQDCLKYIEDPDDLSLYFTTEQVTDATSDVFISDTSQVHDYLLDELKAEEVMHDCSVSLITPHEKVFDDNEEAELFLKSLVDVFINEILLYQVEQLEIEEGFDQPIDDVWGYRFFILLQNQSENTDVEKFSNDILLSWRETLEEELLRSTAPMKDKLAMVLSLFLRDAGLKSDYASTQTAIGLHVTGSYLTLFRLTPTSYTYSIYRLPIFAQWKGMLVN